MNVLTRWMCKRVQTVSILPSFVLVAPTENENCSCTWTKRSIRWIFFSASCSHWQPRAEEKTCHVHFFDGDLNHFMAIYYDTFFLLFSTTSTINNKHNRHKHSCTCFDSHWSMHLSEHNSKPHFSPLLCYTKWKIPNRRNEDFAPWSAESNAYERLDNYIKEFRQC